MLGDNLNDWQQLKNFSLLKQVDEDKLKEIALLTNILLLPENQTIISEDAPAASMFFILSGKVHVSKNDVPIATLEATEYFGEMAILGCKTRSATVVTLEETRLYEITSDVFDKYLRQDTYVIQDLVNTYDKRLRKHDELVVNQYQELKGKFLELKQEISERKQAEQKREKLVEELQTALSEVKTLSGLLPICSNCKKIRDDKGYWNQIESYIKKHSNANFSHSLCPECSKKLYPELYGDK